MYVRPTKTVRLLTCTRSLAFLPRDRNSRWLPIAKRRSVDSRKEIDVVGRPMRRNRSSWRIVSVMRGASTERASKRGSFTLANFALLGAIRKIYIISYWCQPAILVPCLGLYARDQRRLFHACACNVCLCKLA